MTLDMPAKLDQKGRPVEIPAVRVTLGAGASIPQVHDVRLQPDWDGDVVYTLR